MARQQYMDWDRFKRDAWIEHAAIADGKALDGSTVKADKIKSLLLKLNSHFGDNPECWPSQELLAEKMSVSTKTVRRAAEAAQEMSLLIVTLKNRPKRRTVCNHYRIVWSELLLLDRDRRQAFMESIAGERIAFDAGPAGFPDQSDMVADQSDMVADQSDMVADQSDTVSPEHTTNRSPNKSKNRPPLESRDRFRRSTRTRATSIPSEWLVVVSALKAFGVSASEKAVDAAISRGLSTADAGELMSRFERELPRNPRMTAGWLYRWFTGDSTPAPEPSKPDPEQVTKPHGSYFSSSVDSKNEREAIRGRVVKACRSRGMTDDEIKPVLANALLKHGLDPDAICV